jgi:hypothetical protein
VGCSNIRSKEDSLVAAGFRVSVPKTAAQQQKLKSLPPDKVIVVQKGGKTYYVLPDVARNVAYVGAQKSMKPIAKSACRRKSSKRNSGRRTPKHIEWGGWGS